MVFGQQLEGPRGKCGGILIWDGPAEQYCNEISFDIDFYGNIYEVVRAGVMIISFAVTIC